MKPRVVLGFGRHSDIDGSDYAFTLTVKRRVFFRSGIVAFGQAWTNTPLCISAVTPDDQVCELRQVGTTGLVFDCPHGLRAGSVVSVKCVAY